MTWTYTNQPTTVQLDAVRLLIGDVLSADPQMTDEELSYFISVEGSSIRAAMAACRAQIALFARQVDKAVGDLKISYGQRAEHYKALLGELQANLARTQYVGVVGGGISVARKETVAADSDRVAPAFYEGQFDQSVSDDLTE